ncbi:MAG: MBL fold metallo-hydrolase, partial [Muribaculaceae bacterium]|nr:MBL fold metallo-hydrolase [Muribaculaceae bacterium]
MAQSIIMLGTGSAFPQNAYNSCFVVRSEKLLLLTDAGGGNGIFNALKKATVNLDDIHHMFVSHSHTDHILGAVWVARGIVNLVKENAYSGIFHIYTNRATSAALLEICRQTF